MIKSLSGPAYTIPVSDEERAAAKSVRHALSLVLKRQDKFLKYLEVFFGNLEELDNTAGLIKISPTIKRYEHKMRKIFNEYIKEFSLAIALYERSFADDSEMDEVRDLIIENIKNMRNTIIEMFVLLKNVGSETFSTDALETYNQLKNIIDKLINLVRNEWFVKIDFDILGKIKLGTAGELPLSVRM